MENTEMMPEAGVPNNKGKNVSKIAIGVICMIVLVVGFALFLNYKSPINNFKKALSTSDYVTAEMIYKQNNNDTKFVENAKESIISEYEAVKNKYLDNQLAYADAKSQLEKISNCVANEVSTEEIITSIKDIEASRIAFTNADKYFERKKYADAISEYKKVIEIDEKNYSIAQEQIKKASSEICNEAIEEAASQKNKVEAYEILKKVGKDYRNEEYVAKLEEGKIEAQKYVENEIKRMKESNLEKEALIMIKGLYTEMINAQSEEYRDSIVTDLIEKAEAEASQGRYTQAIELLTDSAGKELDVSFRKYIDIYNDEIENEVLSNAKGSLAISYDSIYKQYDIIAKGEKASNIDFDAKNLYARIQMEDNNPIFVSYIGFVRDEWLFMEKIIIDCDGEQFIIPVSFTDRVTDISYGYILEAITLAHVDSDIKQYLSNKNGLIDMQPMMNAMEKANKVIIRFVGSAGKGSMDKVIPQKHIDQATLMWEVFKILKKDPEKISVLCN